MGLILPSEMLPMSIGAILIVIGVCRLSETNDKHYADLFRAGWPVLLGILLYLVGALLSLAKG